MVQQPLGGSGAETPENTTPKRSFGRELRFAAVLIACVLLAVLVTYSLTVNHYSAKESEAGYRFRVLQQYLDSVAYYDYDYDDMLDQAIRAYVDASGDPYTVYYDAAEYEQLNKVNEGHYVGIGVSVESGESFWENEYVKVLRIVSVVPNSPAQKAGILIGDEICAIAAEQGVIRIHDVSQAVATEMIRGEAGSTVTLSLFREISNEKILLDIDVTREELYVKSADWYVSEDDATVGVIRISTFDLTTPSALAEGMEALLDKGVEHFIFDLRDNGGGDLESLIACVSPFLNEDDVILSTKDKGGRETVYTVKQRLHGDEYAACDVQKQDIGKYRGYSYAVLVNGNTASAAELFAAVFRDYSLGKTVGTKTYGKGSMQGIYSLQRIGLEGGIRVTTRMYFPPCGESYNGEGILPDIEVMPNTDSASDGTDRVQDVQLTSAIVAVKSK